MHYEVYGPFWTERFDQGWTRDAFAEFWGEAEARAEGLSRAVGVYVFSTCHGSTYTPWYVGKTCAKGGFRGEIFQGHKLSHYLSASALKRGAPCLHLVPRIEPVRGRFSGRSELAKRDVDALETAMIGMALRANPDVRNSKKTWFIKNCQVPGIMGAPPRGRPSTDVATLRASLGL